MTNLQKITASRDELNHEIVERKRSEQRLSALSTLKENLLGQESLSTKLQLITESVLKILDGDFCRIWLIKEGDQCHNHCTFKDVCHSGGPVNQGKNVPPSSGKLRKIQRYR